MPDPILEPSAYEQQAHSEWEAFVSEGLNAREQKDTSQWKLGYLANEIKIQFGEEGLDKYANEVGVAKNSLRRYRDVYLGWKNRTIDTSMSFNHHLIALGFEDPQLALEYAREQSLSCEAFRLHSSKVNQGVKFDKTPPKPDFCQICHGWRVTHICRGKHPIDN